MNAKKSSSKSKKQNIVYGDVNIPESAFEPQNVKIRISLMVRGDILDAFKSQSEKKGIGYTLLMQQALAEYIEKNQGIEERLARLEQKVFKRHG